MAETDSVQNTSMILDEQATGVTDKSAPGTGWVVIVTAVAMGESDEEAGIIVGGGVVGVGEMFGIALIE